MLTFQNFRGINNVSNEKKKGETHLSRALDVDVGLDAELRRRRGMTLLKAGCYRQLWEGSSMLLAILNGGALVRVVPEGEDVEVHPAMGTARLWCCELPDGRVIFSNGLVHGITDGTGFTNWGVAPPDEAGVATVLTGDMPAGRYAWAATFRRDADGLESQAVLGELVEVGDGGGLLLTNLPQRAGHTLQIYLTTAGGEVFFHAGQAAGQAFSYLRDGRDLVAPCRTMNLAMPPVGRLHALWGARMLVAQGRVLWASAPHGWSHFDLGRDFKQFSADITLVQAVGGGIFVGTEQELAFLAGSDFDSLVYASVMKAPVLLGSGAEAPGRRVRRGDGVGFGRAMVCIAGGWVVAGHDDGALEPLSEGIYRVDLGAEVIAAFRTVDGVPQYEALAYEHAAI